MSNLPYVNYSNAIISLNIFHGELQTIIYVAFDVFKALRCLWLIQDKFDFLEEISFDNFTINRIKHWWVNCDFGNARYRINVYPILETLVAFFLTHIDVDRIADNFISSKVLTWYLSSLFTFPCALHSHLLSIFSVLPLINALRNLKGKKETWSHKYSLDEQCLPLTEVTFIHLLQIISLRNKE